MRILLTGALIFINFMLQSTVFAGLEIFSIRPNTALIIVISVALLRDDVEGAAVGFSTGLLQDIMFGKALGLYALLGMCIGYICGKPFKDFYRENFLLPLFLVVGATAFFEFYVYLFNYLFRGRIDILYYARRIILPSVCYNAFFTIPVYRLVYVMNDFLEKNERGGRRLF